MIDAEFETIVYPIYLLQRLPLFHEIGEMKERKNGDES
jgi:hypothetical protein